MENQRELERQERRAKKDKKNRTIVWIVIAVVVFILAVMKVCEINVNSVKDKFTDSNGKITFSQGVRDDNFPYSLDSSKNVVLKNVNNKIGALTPSSFTVIDSADGKAEYSFSHGYSNPIMRSSGVYTLVYDQGTKSFRLDNTTENIYESQAKRNIFCADVADNGTVVYATTSKEKKCDIFVYSKSLKQLMSFSTSAGYITSIAINDNANKISFVAVNSKNAQLASTVYTMNIGDDEIKSELPLPSGNVIDLEYSSNNAYVIGDSFLSVVVNQKKLKTVYEQSKINTVAYSLTPKNELVLVYNTYDNSTDNTLARIKSGGSIRKEVKVSGTVKGVSTSSNEISVLTGKDIISYKMFNLEKKSSVKVDDSVKSVCQIGEDAFVHRQSLIDRAGANE